MASSTILWSQLQASLKSPDFDPVAFLGSVEPTRLGEVSVLLKRYKEQLAAELVQHINVHYAEFVELSSNLDGVEEMVVGQRKPLLHIGGMVNEIRDALRKFSDEIERRLKEQEEIRVKKKALLLFLDVHDTMARIETLLKKASQAKQKHTSTSTSTSTSISSTSGGGGTSRDAGRTTQLERAGRECAHLRLLIQRSGDRPYIAAVRDRATAFETYLLKKLDACFEAQITRGGGGSNQQQRKNEGPYDSAVVRACLRTYAAMDRTEEAEKVFADVIVRPFVDEHFTRSRLDAGGTRGSCAGLPDLFESTLTFTEQRCSALLADGHALAQGLARPFEFVGVVWGTVGDALMSKLASIFSPGIPDNFRANYAASVAFLCALETKFCPTAAERSLLRQHPVRATFLAKWSFPIYFQLRAQQLTPALETRLTSASALSLSKLEADKLCLDASKATWSVLLKCWAPEVCLPPLKVRFLKLTLQIVLRHCEWVAAQCKASGTQAREGVLMGIAHDAIVLRRRITGQLTAVAAGMPSSLLPEAGVGEGRDEGENAARAQADAELQDIITACLAESGESLLQPVEEVLELAASLVASKTYSGLQAMLRSIPTTFRMSKKPMPTRHSPFVDSLLRPLESFLTRWKSAFEHAPLKRVAEAVVGKIATKYEGYANDVMASVRTTEGQMARLRQMRAQSGAAAGATDADKIRQQLLLDVQQLAQCVVLLPLDAGVDLPGRSEPLQALLASALARIEKNKKDDEEGQQQQQ